MITYKNPVWPHYFADPFVLKWNNKYYAYGTTPASLTVAGRVFAVLHSLDLVRWELVGGALDVPPGTLRSAYWAPEVAECDGRFYLYYSDADDTEEHHRLRVAVSDHPAGPFREAGGPLLPDEPFTIDPHPFRDPQDGQWYLAFAKDFFDGLPGTALAAVPLAADMISVAGLVTPLLRASSDWQIFERQRPLYNKVWDAWYTLEGPTLVAHEGHYFLLYSGGNWEKGSYGVGCAASASVLGPYQDIAPGPVVLSGVPDHALGPGHCSVIAGLEGQTNLVYHAWDAARTARRMCIDPLVWTTEGPRCLGPTWTEQVLC